MKRYLSGTIESVLRNLRSGDEYFVIDGGSSDGSAEVIRGYEQNPPAGAAQTFLAALAVVQATIPAQFITAK
jgi:glycosyltransferase involved in cell wall biosynthesis